MPPRVTQLREQLYNTGHGGGQDTFGAVGLSAALLRSQNMRSNAATIWEPNRSQIVPYM